VLQPGYVSWLIVLNFCIIVEPFSGRQNSGNSRKMMGLMPLRNLSQDAH